MKRIYYLVGALVWLVSCKSGTQPEMLGEYGKLTEVTGEDRAVFSQAWKKQTKNLVPQKVSRQVVAGMNYKYLCKDAAGREFLVTIFQPLSGRGEPQLTAVEEQRAGRTSIRLIVYYDSQLTKDKLLQLARERKDVVYHQYTHYRALALEVTSVSTREAAKVVYSAPEGVIRVVEEGVMDAERCSEDQKALQ